MPPPWRVHILFIVLGLYPTLSDAVQFSQCFADVTSCANSGDCTLNISNVTALSILTTSDGSSVYSADVATGLSYAGCAKYCGSGEQPFSWTTFAQEYAAWLLPYLALLSQLPFGARRRTDNLMSVILTLGSPTLAGYSLYMTLLNARWVNDRLFLGVDYPSATTRQSVVRALSSLQQVPLRVHPGEAARFESLVVHPDNDQWWASLSEQLDYSHQWSIASATSITWVVIAYLLTVADSISNVSSNINSTGQGTGSGWLWLLPIVVGWLVLSPKCDYDRVHDAYHRVNRKVFVADSHDPIGAPTRVTSNFGLSIGPHPDWLLYDRNITSPDELRIPPVFNYARIFSWSWNVYQTSLFYRAAWQKSINRIGVDGEHIPGNVQNDVPRESRLGTCDQTTRYCTPYGYERRPDILFPRGLFSNMVVASIMALQLQWGTTSAAVLVVWFTPTIKLGCRSLAYLLYGAVSTVVWVFLLSSSVLGYYAHHLVDDLRSTLDVEEAGLRTPSVTPPKNPNSTPTASFTDKCPEQPAEPHVAIPLRIIQAPCNMEEEEDTSRRPTSENVRYYPAGSTCARTLARLADWLRWIGKTLAILNAIAIIANSVFQYAGVYSNCYCNSSVLYWGTNAAFNVVNPDANDLNLARSAWIGALALALSCCAFFVGSIYLIRDSLPS